MSSKYKAEFDLPKEFPSILKAFTREVLRYQPENIFEFGATYFKDLLSAHDAADVGGDERMSRVELEQLLRQLFTEHDRDGNGRLNHKEFRALLHSANIGLSKREVKRIMAEADENENGEIDYSEFIPIALDLVQAMYVKVDREQEMDKSRRQTELLLLHGMPREEIEAIMSAIFQKADLDGSGTLSRKEFHSCLRGADLGLTRTEINLIMGSIDADEDGTISYSEFVPLCYSLLVETLRDEIESTRTPTQLEEFLQDLFASHDPDRAGVLPISTLKKALRAADLGLTRLQMHTVLAEARESDDGEVAYGKFAPVAADVIYRLLDSGAQAAKLEAIRALTGPDGKSDGLVHNLDERAMADTLIELFEASDTAQASSLPKGTIKRVLLDAGLDLSQREVQCLLSSADLDVDGAVMYHSLALGAHRQLAYLALQEGMRS